MASPTTYVPHPRDFRTIRESYTVDYVPYVVPTGKVFVLTGLGTTGLELGTSAGQPFLPVTLSAIFQPGTPAHDTWGDGGYDVQGGLIGPTAATVTNGALFKHNFCTIAAVPTCCVYPAGTQIEVFGGQSPSPSTDKDGRAYGYEAPAA